jgi:hypothetical protein
MRDEVSARIARRLETRETRREKEYCRIPEHRSTAHACMTADGSSFSPSAENRLYGFFFE